MAARRHRGRYGENMIFSALFKVENWFFFVKNPLFYEHLFFLLLIFFIITFLLLNLVFLFTYDFLFSLLDIYFSSNLYFSYNFKFYGCYHPFSILWSCIYKVLNCSVLHFVCRNLSSFKLLLKFFLTCLLMTIRLFSMVFV